MYEYAATVVEVIDGDSVWLLIDQGFHTHRIENVRLMGIDAPETNTAAGKVAKAFLTERLPVGEKVIVITVKDTRGKDTQEKYGRYLGTIVHEGINVNALMVMKQLAKSYDGGKRV